MLVEISTYGKFHSFDLARQLQSAGHLSKVYTGYPRFKLRAEEIPDKYISSFPFFITPLLALRSRNLVPASVVRAWDHFNMVSLARWVEWRSMRTDVFIGLSGSGLEAGVQTQKSGGIFVCDRGSAHIRVQDEILRDEHQRWGFPYRGIDPRVIEREEREYQAADLITVPSTFASQSFAAMGIDGRKVRRVPYGVDLTRFAPLGSPNKQEFSVLFVGRVTLQKGIPYLLEAFRQFQHERKRLRIVGPYDRSFIDELRRRKLVPEQTEFLGSVPQTELKRIFSTSDALVLPSVQDGFGMVMAQAMACGCPVVASTSTGAEDLYTHGHEGFVVPTRSSTAIAERLDQLATDRALASGMREAALRRVSSLGGWDMYGNAIITMLNEELRARNRT